MNDNHVIKVAMPQVGEEEADAVREVLLSGNYVSGVKVKEFESAFAKYIGCKYAIAVNSGTAALCIVLDAIGIGKGDEVIVPPMTFFATISAVLYLGAIPVFADIDFDDLCLSPESAEQMITSKTKAIIPVHLYGASAKMDSFIALSKKHNIPLIEDCAQAHGTEYKGKKVGSFGIAGAFSFFATKHMTTGEGGMITTNDDEVAKQTRIIRSHGMINRDDHIRLGYNNRMTEMEASMGLVQLKKLDELNKKRIINSKYLIQNLNEISWVINPVPKEDIKHTYFWCSIMIDENKSEKNIDDLKKHLRNNKIGFRERYKEPLYKQRIFDRLGIDYSETCLPVVEKISGKIIGIPNHAGLSKRELDIILNVLQAFN